MNYCSIKNFITVKERDVLVKYFKDGIERGEYETGGDVCDVTEPEWFVINSGIHGHHSCVNDIMERINTHFEGTENCVNGKQEHQPIINVIPPGARVDPHIDRSDALDRLAGRVAHDAPDKKAITKFIAFINKPDNSSKFYIDNVEIETEETELIIFEPSEKIHEVTKNLSQDHVIILIFARITDISDQWFKSIQ